MYEPIDNNSEQTSETTLQKTGQVVVQNPVVIFECILSCAETTPQLLFLEGKPYKNSLNVSKKVRNKTLKSQLIALLDTINSRLNEHSMSASIKKVKKNGTIKERLVIKLSTSQSILWEDLVTALKEN